MLKTDADGKITCPNCSNRYKPALKPVETDKLIQDVYPDATAEEREQLISGLCNRCQAAVFGDGEE